ncbi:UNVERIFIED_CONTAM: hypothetical protein Sradi_6169800 [Sesamum radiatum]|uniref:Disease resistance N-terminal domain-containing protein n=1 Tax=Sesamum radiatum TaxID=300843 RepID=A0AAW2K899_SESRA
MFIARKYRTKSPPKNFQQRKSKVRKSKHLLEIVYNNWISEIRELAQDAEDVIDSFVLKVETPRRSRGLLGRCACFPEHVYHLDQLGQEIENIRDRLQAIELSRKRYGIEDLGGGTTLLMPRRSEVVEKRQLSPWQRDKDVVGLEEDVEQILLSGLQRKRAQGAWFRILPNPESHKGTKVRNPESRLQSPDQATKALDREGTNHSNLTTKEGHQGLIGQRPLRQPHRLNKRGMPQRQRSGRKLFGDEGR